MCTSISPRAVQGQICKPLLCCREGVGGWVIRGRYIAHTTLQSGAGHIGGGGGAPFDEREEEIGTIDGEEEPRNTKEEE